MGTFNDLTNNLYSILARIQSQKAQLASAAEQLQTAHIQLKTAAQNSASPHAHNAITATVKATTRIAESYNLLTAGENHLNHYIKDITGNNSGPPDDDNSTTAQSDGVTGHEVVTPRLQIETGKAVPHGFADLADFVTFGSILRSGLSQAGYGDAVPIIQGSAISGTRYRTGEAFDEAKRSDFDIAIASPTMLEAAIAAGIGLRSKRARTGPLTPRQARRLGLNRLALRLSSLAGREVYFMIYNSAEAVFARAPGITVP